MDTVFPRAVNIKVRRDGDTLFAPGIGDDSASDANMLQAIRAIKHSQTKLKGTVIFVGTVQERNRHEGHALFCQHYKDRLDMIVALDVRLAMSTMAPLESGG